MDGAFAVWNVESAGHHHGAGRQVKQPASAPGVAESPLAALRVHQGKVIDPGNWEPILDADTLHGITAS